MSAAQSQGWRELTPGMWVMGGSPPAAPAPPQTGAAASAPPPTAAPASSAAQPSTTYEIKVAVPWDLPSMATVAGGVPRYYAESETTWGALLDRAAQRSGASEALSFKGERWSYQELRQRANSIARGLLGIGIGKGSQVALWMPTTPVALAAQFAIFKIGARLVEVPTSAGATALEQHLGHSQAVALLFQDNFWGWDQVNALDRVYELCPEMEFSQPGTLSASRLPRLRHVICAAPQGYKGAYTLDEVVGIGGQMPEEELARVQRAVYPNDPMQILYLADGATPLAPAIPHRMLAAQVPIVADIVQLTSQDRLLVSQAVAPGYQALAALLATYTGAAMELAECNEAESILKTIGSAGVSAAIGSDELFSALLDHPRSETYNLGSLKKGLVVGAPTSWQLVERMQKRGLGGIMNAYGTAEMGLVSATVPADGAERIAATSGRVLPHCRVRVLNAASGQDAPAGQEGEVCVQSVYPGIHMMPGYHHNPEATEQRLDKEGWFHTGDRGFVDGDGYLHIRGSV